MREKTHWVGIFVQAPFDSVWAWVSDPSRFSALYPSWVRWVTKVRRVDGEAYEGAARDGTSFKIVPKLDRKRGQADFEIAYGDGRVEIFRAIVYRLEDGEHPVNALNYQWIGIDDAFQEGMKLGVTKADLHRVKEAIKRDAEQEITSWHPYGPPYDEAFAWLYDSRVGREDGEMRNQEQHLEELEKDRDALLESWAEMVPAGLENLSGVERNKVYRMLNLLVTPAPEGYEVSGAFCTMEPCGF